MLTLVNDREDYLKLSHYIDGNDEVVRQKARDLYNASEDDIDFIRNAFHFVRDEIKHSWDVKDKRVTVTASQTLKEGVGICYAKSNLLAALLRLEGIPAGICYQRLTLGDTPDSGYCIHALNAVYLKTLDKWIRLDARGNKETVHAEFSFDQEMLAFQIRPEYDEIDYSEVYAEPIKETMQVLENSDDAIFMYLNNLPERI